MILDNFKALILDLVGIDSEDYDDYEYQEVEVKDEMEDDSKLKENNSKVTEIQPLYISSLQQDLPTPEIRLLELSTLAEAPIVLDTVNQHKSVILQLQTNSLDEGQRIIDFIVGGLYSLNGSYQQISDRIYLFAPSIVKVQNLVVKDNMHSLVTQRALAA